MWSCVSKHEAIIVSMFSRSVATAFFVNATQCKLQMLFTSLMFFIGTDATAHGEHTSSITGQPFNDPE